MLIHAAWLITVWGELAVLHHQIVEATLELSDACAEFGVRRMNHLSSESVLRGVGPLPDIDETHPCPPRPNSRYGTCKKASEQGLLAHKGVAANYKGEVVPRVDGLKVSCFARAGIVPSFDLALWLVRRLCPNGAEAHLRNYLALDLLSE